MGSWRYATCFTWCIFCSTTVWCARAGFELFNWLVWLVFHVSCHTSINGQVWIRFFFFHVYDFPVFFNRVVSAHLPEELCLNPVFSLNSSLHLSSGTNLGGRGLREPPFHPSDAFSITNRSWSSWAQLLELWHLQDVPLLEFSPLPPPWPRHDPHPLPPTMYL